MSAMSVARFGGVVLLNPPAAERIIDALLRYIGQLPPCRERTDILALTDRLRSAYADTQRKVSQNVSVQRPQGLSCHDPSRDGSQTAAAKPGTNLGKERQRQKRCHHDHQRSRRPAELSLMESCPHAEYSDTNRCHLFCALRIKPTTSRTAPWPPSALVT